MEITVNFTVNQKRHTVTTDSDRPLIEVLREDLGLTGTHFGCGEGECGACSVHIDGKRAFSCQTLISEVDGKTLTTIEGLATNGKLHPVQQAFMDEGAYQCGYCTSGMIMAAVAMFNEKPNPTDDEIRDWMNGNLCRCCGYARIMQALKKVSSAHG